MSGVQVQVDKHGFLVKDAAALLNTSAETVRRRIRKGDLQAEDVYPQRVTWASVKAARQEMLLKLRATENHPRLVDSEPAAISDQDADLKHDTLLQQIGYLRASLAAQREAINQMNVSNNALDEALGADLPTRRLVND